MESVSTTSTLSELWVSINHSLDTSIAIPVAAIRARETFVSVEEIALPAGDVGYGDGLPVVNGGLSGNRRSRT